MYNKDLKSTTYFKKKKMFRHFNLLLSGDTTKKRKRGRPTKSEMLARQQAEREETIERKVAKLKAAEPQQAEEDEDDVVDAGAIDDPEGEKERSNTKNHFVRIVSIIHSPALLLCSVTQMTVTTTRRMQIVMEGRPQFRRSPRLLSLLHLRGVLGVKSAGRGSTDCWMKVIMSKVCTTFSKSLSKSKLPFLNCILY